MKRTLKFLLLVSLMTNAVVFFNTTAGPSSINYFLYQNNSAAPEIKVNKDILLSLTTNADTKKRIEEVPVYVRQKSQGLYWYINFYEKISGRDKTSDKEVALGEANGFYFNQKNKEKKKPRIWLASDNTGPVSDMQKVFKNKEILKDFIFFHEFSHYLSYFNPVPEESMVLEYLSKVSGRALSSKEEELARLMYAESVADVMGATLLIKKYPQFGPELYEQLAAYRLHKMMDVEHITAPSLVSVEAAPVDLDDLLIFARQKAGITLDYYLPVLSVFTQEENLSKKPMQVSESEQNRIQTSLKRVKKQYPS